MTDLTMALSIAGGVVLAAVVAHGAWTARKAGLRRASVFGDAVGRGVEPTLGADTLPGDGAGRSEPGFAAGSADALSATAPRLPPRIDALIDAVAT